MNKSKITYISFDTVPAPKGAAIHIAAFTQALAAAFGQIQLVTVSPTPEASNSREIWPDVIQTQLPAVGDRLINRVLYFRAMLGAWWQGRRFEAVHIRSIYEGFPIALNKQRLCQRLIFEVNGLPSIELKYRYPGVAEDRELLHKLKTQEQICMNAADLILTPSQVTCSYLQARGVSVEKIRIIPNGVDLNVFTWATQDKQDVATFPTLSSLSNSLPFRLLYFGVLAAWQGVHLAVEALALICREFPASLTVIGQGRYTQVQSLKELACKLGVADRLTVLEAVSQAELVWQMHASQAILAPLMPNDRNLVQGCCPLKILEGMATGTPVIASNLPVVQSLGVDGIHLLLVKPGSAKAIKDAVLRLRTEAGLATQLAINARRQIENYYTWNHAGTALVDAYKELGL